MKAPDKVFFPNDINLLTRLSIGIKQKGDVCYIRKDALLEWMDENIKELNVLYGEIFIAHVKDKLNSM